MVVSDISANKEVELPADQYFRCGDVDDLKKKIEILLENGLSEEEQEKIRNKLEERYNWDSIAEQTIEVYERIINA